MIILTLISIYSIVISIVALVLYREHKMYKTTAHHFQDQHIHSTKKYYELQKDMENTFTKYYDSYSRN